jgi:hypothetical protein
LLFGLIACSGSDGGGTSTIVNPPPVQAQTFSYSAAALDGTYTVSMIEGESGSTNSPISFMGSLVFDGADHISSASLTVASKAYDSGNGPPYTPGTVTNCPIIASGTYTIQSNASGTAVLNLAGASVSADASDLGGSANGCYLVPQQLSFNIMAAQQGATFVFQMTAGPSLANFSGVGFKQ